MSVTIHDKNPHAYAMHTKACEENIHAIWYLQENTIVDAHFDFISHFPAFPLPSCSKNPSMPHPPRVLQENSKYLRVWERDKIMRELQD